MLTTLCRMSLSPDSCVRKTETIFTRWGAPSLAVAKFVPGFASVATAMAGVVRLSRWRFLLFDAIGAALWSGVAIAVGYVFRNAINEVLAVLETMGKIGLALIVAGFAALRRGEMGAAAAVHPAAADGSGDRARVAHARCGRSAA